MTLKEKLFQLMEEIAAAYETRSVTVIICCEGSNKIDWPMVGYSNAKGRGTVLIVSAVADSIQKLLNDAWEAENRNRRNHGSSSNSQ